MLLCISNLIKANGSADYKGLDINLISSGSYVLSRNNNAYFDYAGEPVNHPDVRRITQVEYDSARSELEKPPENPTTAKLRELEQKNTELIAADLDNKELIVALYDMLMGGAQ